MSVSLIVFLFFLVFCSIVFLSCILICGGGSVLSFNLVFVSSESLWFITKFFGFFFFLVIAQTFYFTDTLCLCLPGRVKRTLWTQQGEIHVTAPLKGQWFMRLALLSLGLGGIAGIIFCKWVWKCSWPGWPRLIYSSRCAKWLGSHSQHKYEPLLPPHA